MALTALLFLGLVAASQAGVLFKNSPRIVNGEDAKAGEIPYQISLQNKGSNFHFCGGSILNKNYVITAAHCVVGKSASSIQVVAGTTVLGEAQSVHDVQKITVHKKYNSADSWKNDIALLKVKVQFVENRLISFVPLPKKGDIISVKDVAVVSGWGRLWSGGPATKKLQRVNIYIADQAYCTKMYNSMGYNIYNSHVCAYDPSSSKGSCNGDSGGPLTVKGKLIGLVSWARACALTDFPTVYTRVSEFLDWIQQNAV